MNKKAKAKIKEAMENENKNSYIKYCEDHLPVDCSDYNKGKKVCCINCGKILN